MEFELIRPGAWIAWRALDNAEYRARVIANSGERLDLDFGRAPIYRAQAASMLGLRVVRP